MSVDPDFVRRLPKIELHAHLSGSVSKTILRTIWRQKRAAGQCLELQDPVIALQAMPDIFTFFKVFDEYIYELINDEASIKTAVHSVIDGFERDGVVYLELRTTPRMITDAGIDYAAYVKIVLDSIRERSSTPSRTGIEVHLLLCVDRKMTFEQASEVLQLAQAFSRQSQWYEDQTYDRPRPAVLGIDLCGNPMRGDVSIFTPIFRSAQAHGLRTTVHFAEVPESSTESELETILRWQPDRLGHVINVPEHIRQKIHQQGCALELCLSCNVIAKMVSGEYADHHFGYWLTKSNAIALSTDDVGVFESPLSNEYFLAAQHFHLGRDGIIALSRRSVQAAFSSQERIHAILDEFEAILH